MRVVVKEKNKIIAYRKKKGEWLEGQWELPTFVIQSADPKIRQYPPLPKLKLDIQLESLDTVKTGITKYRITNYILSLSAKSWALWQKKIKDENYCWADLHNGNFSTVTTKVLKSVRDERSGELKVVHN
ncbi:MAG: hypothetical protein WCG27_05275 [Pseudomonadota bacterium]